MFLENGEFQPNSPLPVLLLGNKSDITDVEHIPEETIKSWMQAKNVTISKLVSAKTGDGISDAFKEFFQYFIETQFKERNETIQISYTLKEETNSNFRIKKIINNTNISYYSIIHVNTNLILIYSIDNMKNLFLDLINEKEEYALWNFIELENNNYIIHNKKNCYLKIKELNIICDNITMEEASQFNLIKIYEEISDNIINYKLIEKEPIDVLIKYIDLRDPFLKRKGIFQTKKDLENEELRYCIRSILKNIPWVRKIFILMPNEKVRFFKNYSFINDKIVYVKDKDILGHDSSNSLAFQFRFWKLEKYGISDNFIAMDDDYFIGRPLNKTNFFYDINGKIKPLTITSKFTKINKMSNFLNYFRFGIVFPLNN